MECRRCGADLQKGGVYKACPSKCRACVKYTNHVAFYERKILLCRERIRKYAKRINELDRDEAERQGGK